MKYGNLFQNFDFLRPDEKRNAGKLFSTKNIFSGQMKYGAPEIFYFFLFFSSGQMKHRAPEKIGENLKKLECRQ